MNKIDPDILHALKSLAVNEESKRAARITKKHIKQLDEQFQTQMELLTDEVERVIPKKHPMFYTVLLLAVARKIERSQQEPEFQSFVDEGFPAGW
jgi:cob(I)alamin adenosyltransferase